MSFELVDLSYAPEVAQVMLVKQQAEALIEARRLIVGARLSFKLGRLGRILRFCDFYNFSDVSVPKSIVSGP